ncbi:bifunctional diaminohydroxyphosphoribosylaminopyrimidine deaminase/5-amino-6-(5-phosphoribosylamino)uracil reductase RibD [Tuwongella immobilis]|uniref:Riboflavin biosynthesis protein RibD n=1 Tax=Tuwongella immobilis TaxID=692036 RepID=A0A6C2YKR1_9BACT|nr:bifunctional diaminohydroxyphosphoribosylaminopyrimidine deaminase/5-amino-6-(5-phosphoribosylamino)uracil reductase RibD [Tuwongella immobilis]VIP01695.1 riboflavin biosynthesis protein : Riboflavin biosynthesis protein RibD OS=Rhodopirellula maiorica SM1 GN=RMSM_01698 PE=3 SV=1: dCMP_cyt_deam_1: RibD_C [Tuwongella immobilis]VTR99173.1 riboflavin biosynthesis protein : Riboflavin biosynthesis protein RibD OS=Rhodopirellula maiorica SM1 GN=RMSM_01698 PE=3 SV=1: dCMP_cyt_deam_1: RibD_C [Tuwonge
MTALNSHESWMRRALELAARGEGAVEPNPMVGAVVVRDGVCVGEGYHQRYGGPHAEVHALRAAGEFARGATLYVTLEPCCHFGKTPPCTDAVLQSGIAEVIVAMPDPFPAVAGGGLDILRREGLRVVTGVCRPEAERLNSPYLKRLRTGHPYVIAKWAMTLDGKLAAHTGHSQWISGPESRAMVHHLRGRVDGILVGLGTLLADDPHLVARPASADESPLRIATRIVLTRSGNLPPTAKLLSTIDDAPILILTAVTPDEQPALRVWQTAGAGIVTLPQLTIANALTELGNRRMTNLLVEGGSEILGAFFDAQAIDEVMVFIAPKLVGGRSAPTPIAGTGQPRIPELASLQAVRIDRLGDDCCVRGIISPP